MKSAICLLSVIPMRKEPSHRSEMVSQLLFGEYVMMGEEKDDFVFVKCNYDGYEGWVQLNQLIEVSEEEVLTASIFTTAFATAILKNGSAIKAAYGTPVYCLDEQRWTIGNLEINYPISSLQYQDSKKWEINAQNLFTVYQHFINTPYLWGGKSVFGIDCSGFVQQVFKMFGIHLLRDAYLQADEGIAVNMLADTKPGDLAFFCNEGGRVTHVGIILEENTIVHSSGRVRIDTINEKGIINNENGKLTHTLHSIRRFF